MDPGQWGRSAWAFLHGMTLDPGAGPRERKAQRRLLQLLRTVLPCPACRDSYTTYCHPALQKCTDLGLFVCQVHDQVNLKLDKPAAKHGAKEWCRAQRAFFGEQGWDAYVEDMWFFLFAVAANYPRDFCLQTRMASRQRAFFQTLGTAMAHQPWGRQMQRYVQAHPLTDAIMSSRESLMRWLYGMYLDNAPILKKLEAPINTWDAVVRATDHMRF